MFYFPSVSLCSEGLGINIMTVACLLYVIGITTLNIMLIKYSNQYNYNVNMILGIQVFILIIPFVWYAIEKYVYGKK